MTGTTYPSWTIQETADALACEPSAVDAILGDLPPLPKLWENGQIGGRLNRSGFELIEGQLGKHLTDGLLTGLLAQANEWGDRPRQRLFRAAFRDRKSFYAVARQLRTGELYRYRKVEAVPVAPSYVAEGGRCAGCGGQLDPRTQSGDRCFDCA